MAARSSDGKLQELLGTLKTDGVEALDQLMDAYEERRAERASRQKAILRYVTPPTAEQLGQIREFLRKKYENEELPLELVEDKSLLGGFCITVGSEEYDWSMRGRLTQMKNRLTQTPQMLSDSSEVIDLLRTEIDAAAFDGKDHEVGAILLGLIVLVLIIEWISSRIRVKLARSCGWATALPPFPGSGMPPTARSCSLKAA